MITFEFATQDDCLEKMVPSDLRALVAERDCYKGLLQEALVKFDERWDSGIVSVPVYLMKRMREALK